MTEQLQIPVSSQAKGTHHICLLGPPGSGKSPLSSLFRLDGLDPLRVRVPRNKKDEPLCMTELRAENIFKIEVPNATWPSPQSPPNWIEIGSKWLFIGVRGDRQCLRFIEDNGEHVLRTPKRVEIFGPRLLDILKNPKYQSVGLRQDNLLVLLLNPSAKDYASMNNGVPNEEVERATFYALTTRTELQRKPVDLPDTFKRIRGLQEEIQSWTAIKNLVGTSCIEFTNWKHFEFRYSQPNGSLIDAQRELLSARDTILKALYRASSLGSASAQWLLSSDYIRSSEDILTLTDIV